MVNFFYLAPAVLCLALLLAIGLEGYFGGRRIRGLGEFASLEGAEPPLVSVVIAALNEEEEIEAALASVLALDYPRLEIIVIDDRSTDATGAILERMAALDQRMRVIHVRELPVGWLGKNHALHLGAARARGEYLLFSDADVSMAPDTLGRAMRRVKEQDLDHLCMIFRPVLPNALLAMLVVDSLSGLVSVLKPWKAADPNSRSFFGVGGFNLARTAAYRRIGGHESIRLCPVDDILLGRLLKEGGGRSECLNGRCFVSVPWYGSVGEMIRGLRKNLFAALDYRFHRLLLASALIVSCHILPLWGLLLADGPLRLVCGLILLVTGLSHFAAARGLGVSLACLAWFPVTPYIKLYMMWKAVLATLIQGGIEWRGTFYPLVELKRNMVPLWPWQGRALRGTERGD